MMPSAPPAWYALQAGKVPDREYFAWLKDHAGKASFAIDDEEFCALFDVEPEDLRAWRTADAG